VPDQRFSDICRFWKWLEIHCGFLKIKTAGSSRKMNSFPRLLSGIGRKDAAWVCSSCAKAIRSRSETSFFKSSLRNISDSSRSRQNVAPTMEQLRAPFKTKNRSTLYYTFSIILGTVAFSYGSVPMYKMVRLRPPFVFASAN
jgi:hypothetical protein